MSYWKRRIGVLDAEVARDWRLTELADALDAVISQDVEHIDMEELTVLSQAYDVVAELRRSV